MGARVLIVVVLLAGCQKRSALYCAQNPGDTLDCPRLDASTDGPIGCGSNADCPIRAPHCVSNICVQCLADGDCTNSNAMFCNLATNTCQGCVAHADCTQSNACLPTGECGDDSNVEYVDPLASGGTTCTHAAPCNTISMALAVAPLRPYIKLTGQITEAAVALGTLNVTLLADPGTRLKHLGALGNAIVLQGAAGNVKIYDLEIVGTAGATGITLGGTNTLALVRVKIHACKLAIDEKGGDLVIDRSEIYGNAGGITLTKNFDLTNNFIHHNGDDTIALVGGVSITTLALANNRFEFNTVIDNRVVTGAGGVVCTTAGFIAPNNLIVRNYVAGDPSAPDTSGVCGFTMSLSQPDVTGLDFVAPDVATPDYHIGPASIAKDMAPATSTVVDDVDGQYRPVGSGKDYGADEYKP